MKKIILVSTILLLIFPTIIKANIICNDGTESPTCSTCHTGCCSGHNGCTNNVNHYSSKKKNEINNEHGSISKTDFILILVLLSPLLISILIGIHNFFKDFFRKIKSRK